MVRAVVTILIGFCFGTMFWRLGDNRTTVAGVLNIMVSRGSEAGQPVMEHIELRWCGRSMIAGGIRFDVHVACAAAACMCVAGMGLLIQAHA